MQRCEAQRVARLSMYDREDASRMQCKNFAFSVPRYSSKIASAQQRYYFRLSASFGIWPCLVAASASLACNSSLSSCPGLPYICADVVELSRGGRSALQLSPPLS